MADFSREEQIQQLKALRTELLSEYENKSEEVESTEEAVLLRQALLENYNYSTDSEQTNSNYKDEETDEDADNEPHVKVLTRGRSL